MVLLGGNKYMRANDTQNLVSISADFIAFSRQ